MQKEEAIIREVPDLRLEPQLLVCGSPLWLNNQVEKTVTITNHGEVSSSFSWNKKQSSGDGCQIEFEPMACFLKPGESRDITLRITPLKSGELRIKLTCQVINTDIVLCSWLTATVCVNNSISTRENDTHDRKMIVLTLNFA